LQGKTVFGNSKFLLDFFYFFCNFIRVVLDF
jgi:hypothetical protein